MENSNDEQVSINPLDLDIPLSGRMLQTFVSKIMALERTVLNSPQRDDYLKYQEEYSNMVSEKMDEVIKKSNVQKEH
ncbi:MAG: hypothetical protein JSS82_08095 [Bacteroidetes bacterium]|nr:hypothetical protein [Bacteroidota bacterium]